MLGQSAAAVAWKKAAAQLSKQLVLMAKGEAPPTFEGAMAMVDANDAEVLCRAIILKMQTEKVSSFVLIFQNVEDDIAKQKEAEAAKTRSEELLFQILPRDIVIRLSAGERDICFTVPYATALMPQQIMVSLAAVFAAFDRALAEYAQLTKVKLIGDVYMTASSWAPRRARPRTPSRRCGSRSTP
jgi:hypothetical protein